MIDLYNRNLINQIKRINHNPESVILQLRYGSGLYSEILKQSYPDGKISIMEKHAEKVQNIDKSRFSEIIINDYSEKTIPELQEKFDIVTLGSNQNFNLFSTKFNINTTEEFTNLIKHIDFYLKTDGEIVILTRSDKFDNKSQKNYIKALYFTQSYDEQIHKNKIILNEQQIIKTFKETLLSIGNYIFKTEYIKKDPKLNEDVNCLQYLKEKNYTPLPEVKEKALKIDTDSKKYGQENGYLLFLRAKKQR